MADYTEFELKATLTTTTPEEIIGLLTKPLAEIEKAYPGNEMTYEEIMLHRSMFPKHPLFNHARAFQILGNNEPSTHFPKDHLTLETTSEGHLLSIYIQEMKDYCDEVDLFLDWLSPYVIEGSVSGEYAKESRERDQQIKMVNGKLTIVDYPEHDSYYP